MMLVEPGKRNVRQRTAFAIEDCELAFLSKSNADKIAEQHPEMLTSFQNLASRKACVEHERLNMSDTPKHPRFNLIRCPCPNLSGVAEKSCC